MQMQAKLFATAMKQWERLGKADLLSYALSIQFLSGSSLEVHAYATKHSIRYCSITER
jgi:hypothetical protein